MAEVPDHEGRLPPQATGLVPERGMGMSDGLALKYSALAEDGGAGSQKREAAALYAVAEGYLESEDAAAALKAAADAKQAFEATGDSTGAADALRQMIHAKCLEENYDEATKLAEEELAVYSRSGDKAGEAKMLCSLAQICAEKKSGLEEAVSNANKAVSIFQSSGDKKMEANALLTLISVNLANSDTRKGAEEAKITANNVVTICRDIDDKVGEARALDGLAAARAMDDNMDGALRAAKEALAIFQEKKMRKKEAQELHVIAKLHLKEEDSEEAVAMAEEALDILGDDLRAGGKEAAVMQTLVQACIQKKDPKMALRAARDELERFEEAGNKRCEALAQEMLMLAYYDMQNPWRAALAARRAVEALREAADSRGEAKMLRQVCRLSAEIGKFDQALKAAEESLTIFEDMEDLKEQALTLQRRADVYMQKEEHDKAQRCATEARELYQDAKESKGEAEALLQLSRAQLANKDNTSAATHAGEAQLLFSEAGDMQGESDALHTLVNIYFISEDWEAALRALGKLLTLERDLGHKGEEAMVMSMTAKVILQLEIVKEAEGKGSEKSYKAACDKALKQAKEALSIVRKGNDPLQTGAALQAVAQCQMMAFKLPEALKSATESITVFAEAGDASGEAASLTVKADILLTFREIQQAREAAEEAIWLYQQIGDQLGEDSAWTELERIDKVDGERRAAEMQAQMAQYMQNQQPQYTPITQQYEVDQPAAQPSAPGAGYDAKLTKLDVSAGLSPDVVKSQIMEVTKGLIGYDEEVEYDAPLMEVGLTSNTAVLLRDALTQTLPGLNLPVTLVFDYPSIQSMTELIVEKSEKAAKKALKGK